MTNHGASTDKPFKFYNGQTYYQELAKQISKTIAGDRIVLTTMSFKSGESQVKQILEQLSAAAKRGVNSNLIVDAYSFLARDNLRPGPLFYFRKLPKRMPKFFQDNFNALEEFKRNGGRYSIINQPMRQLTWPFAGRCHIKLAIINDRIYLGGCNLANSGYIDMMVCWKDKFAADWLFDITKWIASIGNSRIALEGQDLCLELSRDMELLIDSGVAKQSIILHKAFEIIDQAQHSIFIACQYFPNSATVKHLMDAHRRGVVVTIIYNHPRKHGIPKNVLHHLVILRERQRAPSAFMKDQVLKNLPYMHGKLLASEQAAIIGSHNFVSAGVNFGTTEIALLRYDPNFAKQAINTFLSQLHIP